MSSKKQIWFFFISNSLILNNLYWFLRSLETLICIALFIESIYETFCQKEFLSATFVVVKIAFDTVHIPIHINHLLTLNVPQKLCLFVQSLFLCRTFQFFILSGVKVIQISYKELSQAVSGRLLNVYISSVSNVLTKNRFRSLFYVDDIIVYSKAESLGCRWVFF